MHILVVTRPTKELSGESKFISRALFKAQEVDHYTVAAVGRKDCVTEMYCRMEAVAGTPLLYAAAGEQRGVRAQLRWWW